MKVTKKLFKELTVDDKKLYTTNKYITNGEIALIKDVIDNPNDIINIGVETIVGNQDSFNNVLDTYTYTSSKCEVLKDSEINIADFKYKGTEYSLGGSYNSTVAKLIKQGRNNLYKKGEYYATYDKDVTFENCIGINSYYLDLFNKLNKEFKGNLALKEVVLREYMEGTSYEFLTGYYRIVDTSNNDKFIGVIMGVISRVDIMDTNRYIVLEPLDDNTDDKIIVGNHIKL